MEFPGSARGRAACALEAAVLILLAASSSPVAAGSSAGSTLSAPGAPSASTLTTASNSTSSVSSAASLGTNTTDTLAPVGNLTILYYFIPELTVLAFFAVGIYLILVRGGKPRRTGSGGRGGGADSRPEPPRQGVPGVGRDGEPDQGQGR